MNDSIWIVFLPMIGNACANTPGMYLNSPVWYRRVGTVVAPDEKTAGIFARQSTGSADAVVQLADITSDL